MRLIGLAVVLALALTLAPRVAKAQEAATTYRIGWLAYGWTEGAERTSPEFVQELKKHLQTLSSNSEDTGTPNGCLGWPES